MNTAEHTYMQRTTADPRRCWEVDVMDPNKLRDRVRQAVRRYMDLAAWDRTLEAEAAERESMQVFHQQWQRQMFGSRAR